MSNRIVVIGAGVIGATAAYCLAERGFAVTVIDRDGPEARACSFGNAGMIVPSHFIPLAAPGMATMALRMMGNPKSAVYVRPRVNFDFMRWAWRFWRASGARQARAAEPFLRDIHLASRAEYEKLAVSLPEDFYFSRHGLLMLCNSEHGLKEELAVAQRADALGIPTESLTPAQLSVLEPDVKMSITGGVLYPRDAHLDPGRLMIALRHKLESRGAQFKWNSTVAGWNVEAGNVRSIRLASGETITGEQFVLCGGSWSDAVARDLRLSLPLQPGKGYSLTVAQPKHQLHRCAILTEARIAVTPMGDTLRFGGTMELAGFDSRINPMRIAGIVESIPRYFPQFVPETFAGIKPWFGFRPCSPDGLPYLGRPKTLKNLIVATGHAMMGISLAPITGRLVAEVASGEKPSLDLNLVNPDRFR